MRRLLFILGFLLTVSAPAETINMFSGVPLGGFGDIASNVIVAQILKRLRPELTIQFHVSENAYDRIRTLIPELDPQRGVQEVGGIRFYFGRRNPLPRGDIFLGLSIKQTAGGPDGYAKDVFLPDVLNPQPNVYEILRNVANAPVVFHFREYGGSAYQVTGSHSNGVGGNNYYWETGPTSTGLYVTPSDPLPVMERSSLEADLVKRLNVSEESFRGRKLAVAYSTYRPATDNYLAVMAEYARSRPNEQITLVIRRFPGQALSGLPANLTVVAYDNLPFEITRALIAHSEAPLLVTGDVSLSLAIDYRKLFLYEMHHWKWKSLESFLSLAAAIEPAFAEPTARELLARFVHLPGDGTSARGYTPERLREMGRLLADDTFRNRMVNVLNRLKEEHSLPQTLLRALDALQGLNLQTATRAEVNARLEVGGIHYQPPLWQRALSTCALWMRYLGILRRTPAP